MALLKKIKSIFPRNLVYCDAGAREGVGEPWSYFRDIIDLVSFEPDKQEFESLLKTKRKNDCIYSCALSKESGNALLNLTKSRGCSSIYKPNYKFLENFPESERYIIDDVVDIKTDSLDELHSRQELADIDFIKIDVQGSELDILEGGQKILSEKIIGIEVEVEFQPLYEGQPLFSDIDSFIRNSLKLELHDLRKAYWKYSAGMDIGTKKGKLIFGEALYLRSPHEVLRLCSHLSKEEAANKITITCLIGLVYGYLDYSFSLLSQPALGDFLSQSAIHSWKKLIISHGQSLAYGGVGSERLYNFFNLLSSLCQPTHGGWSTSGHRLGARKKMGVFV